MYRNTFVFGFVRCSLNLHKRVRINLFCRVDEGGGGCGVLRSIWCKHPFPKKRKNKNFQKEKIEKIKKSGFCLIRVYVYVRMKVKIG